MVEKKKTDQSQPETNKKSLMETIYEVDRKEAREQELRERERQKKQAEEDYKQREAYGEKLAEEKRELIALRQGLIDEKDASFIQSEEKKKYTIREKIANFFYHNSWWLGIGVFGTLLVGFLVVDYLTKVNPDVVILLLSDDFSLSECAEQIEMQAAEYAEDYNDDGKVTVSVYYIPSDPNTLSNNTREYVEANNSKLVVQMQSADAVLIISDNQSDQSISADQIMTNLEKSYGDNPQVEDWKFYLKDSFLQTIGYEETANEGLYIGLRTPRETYDSLEEMQENYDHAIPILEGFMDKFTEPTTVISEAE